MTIPTVEVTSGESGLTGAGAAGVANPLFLGRLRSLRVLLGSTLYANSVYLIIANAANAALGFAFWIVAARLYRPEDVGIAAAAVSASTLLVVLSDLGFEQAIVRFLYSSPDPAVVVSSSLCVESGK